jgi:hypothetical protein
MVRYQIHKVGDDVVITRDEASVREAVKLSTKLLFEVAEEILEHVDVVGYPIELEVKSGTLEIPYDEFFRLVDSVKAN